MSWRVVQALSPGVRSGSTARSFCSSRLLSVLDGDSRANDVVADVATIAHELAVNAVDAGARELDVGMALLPDRVRLAVVDDAPGIPALQPADPGAARGRGLRIVAALSASWGVTPCDADRKAVWAEVLLPTSGE